MPFRNFTNKRFILFPTIILLCSCENKKGTMRNKQKELKKEMEQVKLFYYKKLDSLDSVKRVDTSSAKQLEIANELVAADRKKTIALFKLQKQYDDLEIELKK